MSERTIDLVYFDGCSNTYKLRTHLHSVLADRLWREWNLSAALEAVDAPTDWSEWDLASDATPERYRGHGSPTVLVDGRNVTGVGAAAMACRSDGAPSVSAIVEYLRQSRSETTTLPPVTARS